MIGGISLKIVLGEGEHQANIVGLKVGRSTTDQGAFVFDYIDYTTDDGLPRTTEYSTWNPDKALINYATHSIDKYQWNIDCDTATYGMPNIIASIGAENYPSDAQGNVREEYDNFYYEIEQVIDGIPYIHKLYRSYIGTQLTIVVAGGMNIKVFEDWLGIRYMGQGSVAEVPFVYDAKDSQLTDQSFVGNGVEFSFVLRQSLKDLVLIDDEPELGENDFFANGFLWSKIGSVDNNIENTQGWMYRGDFSGDVMARQVVMYPTVEDALLDKKQLADTTIEQVVYDDTISSEIFTKYSYEVKLGCNFETSGILHEWAVYDEANNGMAIQGWQITLNLVSAVFTAYTLNNAAGNVPLVNIDNPWQDLSIIYNDLWADFMSNMKFFFGSDFGKVVKWILLGLVVVAGVFVFFKVGGKAILMKKLKKQVSGLSSAKSTLAGKISSMANTVKTTVSEPKKYLGKVKGVASTGYSKAKSGFEWVKRKVSRK